MPHRLQKNVRNRILAALPDDEFKRLMDKLHYVELALGESLHRAGEPIEDVFFVESGFISALTMLSDGAPLEIGLIGAEGVAGVSVILGATSSYSETNAKPAAALFVLALSRLKRLSRMRRICVICCCVTRTCFTFRWRRRLLATPTMNSGNDSRAGFSPRTIAAAFRNCRSRKT